MRVSDAWEGTLALFFCASTWLDSKKKPEEERACVSRHCRAARHTKKKEPGTGRVGVCVGKLVLIFPTHFLLTIKAFKANAYFCVGNSFLIFPRTFC